MVKEIAGIVNTGLELFLDERRRHFSKRLKELLEKELELESAVFPNRSNFDIDMLKKEIEIFLIAYGSEFSEAMKNVKININ